MKLIHVTFAQLQVLIAIAEIGSFTAAGAALGLTQSAVSHVINNLEAILSVKLFERNRNGALLTEAGVHILAEAYATVARMEQLQQIAAELNGLNRGTLRLGSFTSVATYLLPQALKTFQSMYPNIEVILREGTDDEVKMWLRDHVIEVGVVVAPCDEFETFPLVTDELCVVIPSRHPLASFSQLSLEQLATEPFIMSTGGCEPLIRNAFNQSGLTPNVTYMLRDIGTIFAFVRSGLGITVVPTLSINGSLDDLRLIKLVPSIQRHICFAVRDANTLTPVARQFINQTHSI